jgi:hypothetical protein
MMVMKAKEIEGNIYEKLISLNYARKVNDFDESGDTHFEDLDLEIQNIIRTFPVLYVDHRNDLMDIENLDGEQQFYIFQNELGFYLVDTQGYNYPRYITELFGFEIDEIESIDPFEMMESLVRINDSKMFDLVAKSLAIDLKLGGFDREDILNYLELKLAKAFGSAE